jgi:GNAT superfamily N-acetyltransferase
MTATSEILIVAPERGDEVFDQLETLFRLQMGHLSERGMLVPMRDKGERSWREEIERAVGRTGVVFVAMDGREAVAFLYGLVRALPDYLGGGKYATMPQFHVRESHRGRGIGRQLFEEFERWCASRKCESIETYVVMNDSDALAVWETLGFEREHLQIRKFI